MKRLKEIIKSNKSIYRFLISLNLKMVRLTAVFVPDDVYVKWQYRRVLGKKLNLTNPTSFNEKIQWLKLNWRDEILAICSDKYLVRDYVKSRIGGQALTKLYGVYDSVEDIVLEDLPDSFVLKVTHGSGQNIICKNKEIIDWKHSFALLKIYMANNHYYFGREFGYKNVVPRIICEEFLQEEGGSPKDYKFYCFNGIPRFIEVHFGRFCEHRNNLYDLDWNLLPVKCTNPQLEEVVDKPACFEEMYDDAAKLAKGLPFVRVDLYNIGKQIYFGEMTFYPVNGFDKFDPDKYDYILGSYLQLPNPGVRWG